MRFSAVSLIYPVQGLPHEVSPSQKFQGLLTRSRPHSFRGLPNEVLPSPNPRLASQGLALKHSKAFLTRSCPQTFQGLPHEVLPSPTQRLASQGLALTLLCLFTIQAHLLFIRSMCISDSYFYTFVS